MKTAALALLSFFIVLPVFGVVFMPPTYGTNDLTTMRTAADLNATRQSYFYVSGKLDRMEHEIDRLETGFLALSIVIGSAVAGVCLLSVRDAIRAKHPVHGSRPVKPCADSMTVQGRI